MILIDELAKTALSGDALRLRSLTQDWLAAYPRLADCPPPNSSDPSVLAVSAGLVELFAQRRGQPAPAWVERIGSAPVPTYLVKAASSMRRLRELCEAESPLPLRRRNLFAPPTFLESA